MSLTGASDDPATAIARALNVDPLSVRADTPLTALGWTGSASEWLLVADHLGLQMRTDPPVAAEPSTIGELVAIVEASSRESGRE